MKQAAAGYIRVSSKVQAEQGESLKTQRAEIVRYAKYKGWKLLDTYADEGISGRKSNRPGFTSLMADAQAGKFQHLVVYRLSRLGRSARDVLNKVEALKQLDIQVHFVTESIDTDTRSGRFLLTVLAAVAQMEAEALSEITVDNKVTRANNGKGRPTTGGLPIGRTYNKETGQWGLDERVAGLLRGAAEDFLNGRSLKDIAHELKTQHGLPTSYVYLLRVLKYRCADTWTVKYKGHDPITYTVPRILPEKTIQAIKERLEHNRSFNRTDIRKYALSGFIRCAKCGKALFGHTQQGRYAVYRHPGGQYEPCRAFTQIALDKIEDAVFRTIFENSYDEAGFNEAIKESLPDSAYIEKLNARVEHNEKELAKLDEEFDRLVDAVAKGIMKGQTVKKREDALYRAKDRLEAELEADRQRLKTLPNVEEVQQQAKDIRYSLISYFGSEEHLEEMSYEEKRRMLHAIFQGKDVEGVPYGVYVERKDEGMVDYYIYAQLFAGTRTLKGEDINYTKHLPSLGTYLASLEARYKTSKLSP